MKSAAKRTRISKGQSKNGCFTCKARKVKCDEQKPSCLRCQQAKLECEGYPHRAIEDDNAAQSSQRFDDPEILNRSELAFLSAYDSSPASDLEAFDPTEEQTLVRTGLDLLLNSYDDEHAIGQDMLRTLILHYVWSSTAVTTACAAFGAATELQQRPRSQFKHLSVVFETLYGRAMRMIKQEIESFQYDRYAVLACCVILTAIEAILRRRQNALKHLRGACQVFYASPPDSNPSTQVAFHILDESGASDDNDRNIANIDVDFLLRIHDIDTLRFTNYTSVLAMHPISIDDLENMIQRTHIADLTKRAFFVLHASSSFINKLAYCTVEQISTVDIEGDHIKYMSLLQQLILTLTTRHDSIVSGPGKIHLLVLRNLCISAMIELQAILAEQEIVWDSYGRAFEQLIYSAEIIVRSHREWKSAKNRPQIVGFTTQSGVLQPLYLAALKYRDSDWRRRAVRCLRMAEREGPWIGEMLAGIAQRIIDLEEAFTTIDVVDRSAIPHERHVGVLDGMVPSRVPENARISHVSIMEESGAIDGDLWPSANSGKTMIKILKRRQPVSILPVLIATSSHLGQEEARGSDSNDGQLDSDCWSVEHEWIEFGPGQDYRVLRPAEHLSQ